MTVMYREPAKVSQGRELSGVLRPADARELLASGYYETVEPIIASIRHSVEAWTVFRKGSRVPLAIYGVGSNAPEESGVPWLLAAEDFLSGRGDSKQFSRAARSVLEGWLDRWPLLYNQTHAHNLKHLRWLKWAGFTLQPEIPHPVTGEPFIPFYMAR